MKCEPVRNRVLALEDPSKVPPSLADHFKECSVCRTWHRTFLKMEASILQLPVPPDSGHAKAQLLEQLRPLSIKTIQNRFAEPEPTKRKKVRDSGTSPDSALGTASSRAERNTNERKSVSEPPVVRSVLDPPLEESPRTRRTRRESLPWGTRVARLWPAGAVAATLLIGTVAWLSMGTKKPNGPLPPPPDPMLEAVVQANIELTKADTPTERLQAMAKLADEIHNEAKTLARIAPGEDMNRLAELYGKIVRDGLVEQANLMPQTPNENRLTDDVSEQLARVEQSAERLATEVPPASQKPMLDIALAARDGKTLIARRKAKGGA